MTLEEIRRRIRQGLAGDPTREWDRLCSTPIARTEYLITSHCLARYLPRAGFILDAGCGPGRYTVDLARRGYQVMMFDLMREYLQFGRAKVREASVEERVSAPIEGDIAALPYADRVFDAVICLGAPLSHLVEGRARSRAVEEMARVTRPGGWVFLTGIGRLAGYRGGIYWAKNWQVFDVTTSAEARTRGIVPGSMIWYTFAAGELESLAQRAGLDIVDRVGCEGLAAYLPMDHLAKVEADPQRWPVWKEIVLETCNEPTIIGVSNHLLVVARKAG
jgi:SAM-dependent methyltransferase